jgi:hypothetical protein
MEESITLMELEVEGYVTRYYHGPTTTTNWQSYNNEWNQRKINYAASNYHGFMMVIVYGWMDKQQWKQGSKNFRKYYYLVLSYVKPLAYCIGMYLGY